MNDVEPEVRLRPEPHDDLTLRLPEKALRLLEVIASRKGMTCEALVRQYIGRGLNEDRRALFEETVLEVTAGVLAEEIGEQRAEQVVDSIRARFRDPR